MDKSQKRLKSGWKNRKNKEKQVGKIENKTNDFAKVARIHEKIIRLYKKDFSKYEILVISENRNLFKLFLSDVGLLTSCYSNQVKIAILNKEKSINNGALFENVIAQELLAKGHVDDLRIKVNNKVCDPDMDFLVHVGIFNNQNY